MGKQNAREQDSPRNKFQKHVNVLVWKSYLQRLRRWKILVAHCVFALILCIVAVYMAKPVFLTPLEDEPMPPIPLEKIYKTLPESTILGFAPKEPPYDKIMARVAEILGTEIISAADENHLNQRLYTLAKGSSDKLKSIIWILWEKQNFDYLYKYRIRSTDETEVATSAIWQLKIAEKVGRKPHMKSGFLAVECAINHALLEHTAKPNTTVNYELSLASMPVSPLMEKEKVRRAVSLILMCYVLLLLPPVVETEALVVLETERRFKRALRVRSVDYSTIYLSWLMYAFFTAVPVCMIGSITLILIFRWIHLMYTFITLLSYFAIMMVLAFIMSMFHSSALISATWTIMQTLLQAFLSELIVHHTTFDVNFSVPFFLMKTVIPSLGLLQGFNQFALLHTGHQMSEANSMAYTILSWALLLLIYFMILMLLQRTIGSAKAIGGQVSWKSIIFKKAIDKTQLRPIKDPSLQKLATLQSVDELTAKAATFHNVSKSIMGVSLLKEVTFHIYRGEFTSIFAERIQHRTMSCVEDMLTGLTHPDSGSIYVLGVALEPNRNLLTEHCMTGYCDRSSILLEDLTVEEHLYFYTEISLWHEISEKVYEFSVIRHSLLKKECDLADVYNSRVGDLSPYYRAQLCWAIAILLEPRLVILPYFDENPIFKAVIKDKIMTHRTFLTVVSLTLSSMELQYADRLLLLDNRVLAFSGTPAYMFYVFGRDYRIRINFETMGIRKSSLNELITNLCQYGAKVRTRHGRLLILMMPTSPSTHVAKLTEYVENNAARFRVTALYVSLPDPEEVFRRAIHESRQRFITKNMRNEYELDAVLHHIAKEPVWKPHTWSMNFIHLRVVAWKYLVCYIHYRFFLILTILSAIVAGASLGLNLSLMLKMFEFSTTFKKRVEMKATGNETILMVRVDESEAALAVARAYVLSHTNATDAEVGRMSYLAMVYPESLREYLVTRAIDSPQQYVHMYAYGMDIRTKNKLLDLLRVKALYSPLHQRDEESAARSIARVYMALMRYYSGHLNASIEIEDSPLISDYTVLLKRETEPSLLIQFLLVLSISHMTLVPSKEHGLIRHMQVHAMNFSPFRYWINLAICDVILYWVLVFIITVGSISVMLIFLIKSQLHYWDLLAVPLMLMVYGIGCVPQSYLFSLGPNAPLNSMALIITNIVFGEATLVAKLLEGDMYNYALSFLALSPQFNVAYALVKIRQIFLYNSECVIFEKEKLCANKILHKCCENCGVLQECYKRKSYLKAIMFEIGATLCSAVLMFTILMLWEYKLIQLVWHLVTVKISQRSPVETEPMTLGAINERDDVIRKRNNITKGVHQGEKQDAFGENLLIVDATRVEHGHYAVRDIYLGLSKGEALALSGLKSHGRLVLCQLIAGYKTTTDGHLWAVSKYRQKFSPHRYARQVTLCSDINPLPEWMTVYDALEMLAIIRGVPSKYIRSEIANYIIALGLKPQQDLQICHLLLNERTRLHFAAAVIGAPPIVVLIDCTAYQDHSTQRAMYSIIGSLVARGHSIVHSAYAVEAHMPVTSRLAIIRDGLLYDVDLMPNLQERHGRRGFTVVIHLKDDVDITAMFSKYFDNFIINDTSDVLVNLQILDTDLTWARIFKKMEMLLENNEPVYSYIVCTEPIDFIYQEIVSGGTGLTPALDSLTWLRKVLGLEKKKIKAPVPKLMALKGFVKRYNLINLQDLPWSVIFQR